MEVHADLQRVSGKQGAATGVAQTVTAGMLQTVEGALGPAGLHGEPVSPQAVLRAQLQPCGMDVGKVTDASPLVGTQLQAHHGWRAVDGRQVFWRTVLNQQAVLPSDGPDGLGRAKQGVALLRIEHGPKPFAHSGVMKPQQGVQSVPSVEIAACSPMSGQILGTDGAGDPSTYRMPAHSL